MVLFAIPFLTRSLRHQYYDDTFPTAKEKKAFERNLFNKTHRVNGEIIMLDGLTCVYKSSVDLFFYVMGSANENGVMNGGFGEFVNHFTDSANRIFSTFQLILLNVLTCFYDAVFQILRKNVEKRYLMDNLDVIILALDEICDRG